MSNAIDVFLRPLRCRTPLELLAALSLGVLCMSGVTRGADRFDEQATSLFDGKTLDGWEGDTRWFRVEEGCIVAGRLDKRIPHNQFLCSEETFGNFELRLEAKLVGEGNNAGVQFRSQRVPDSSEVSGYQADIGSAWNRPVWGALYDESRRRKMLAEPDPEKLQKLVREGDWNELRIRCIGNHIQIFLNGQQTVDYIEQDDSISAAGLIGLQIHSGPPTEAWYRKIRIRRLGPADGDENSESNAPVESGSN